VKQLLTACAFLLVAGAALAQGFLPLAVGNRWSYTSDLVGPDIREVIYGPDPLFEDTYVIEYDVSDHSPGLRNTWSADEEGDVFLHGFRRIEPRVARYYDPPLRLVNAPLYAGKTWAVTTNISSTIGGPVISTMTIRYTVTEPVTVVVDGRERQAWGVLESVELATNKAAGIGTEWATDGRPFDLAKADDVIVPHWWVRDVGEVQYRSIGIFTLVDYFLNGIVGNEDLSVSELKRAFR